MNDDDKAVPPWLHQYGSQPSGEPLAGLSDEAVEVFAMPIEDDELGSWLAWRSRIGKLLGFVEPPAFCPVLTITTAANTNVDVLLTHTVDGPGGRFHLGTRDGETVWKREGHEWEPVPIDLSKLDPPTGE